MFFEREGNIVNYHKYLWSGWVYELFGISVYRDKNEIFMIILMHFIIIVISICNEKRMYR